MSIDHQTGPLQCLTHERATERREEIPGLIAAGTSDAGGRRVDAAATAPRGVRHGHGNHTSTRITTGGSSNA
jgi:hypothetical protein